jgi:hypothetical protein
MKTIELRTGTLKNGTEASFSEFIKTALDTMPEGGFTMKDFRERGRIEQEMCSTSDEKTFTLEDYDASILKKLINSVKWALRDPFIFEFIEYIEKL